MKYVFRKKANIALAMFFDALGYFLTRLFRHRHAGLDRNFTTVLVIRMDHLGDVLPATAVPKLIKENFPSTRLIFLTSSWSAGLLEQNPFVDEVLIFDAPWFSKKRYKRDARSLDLFELVRLLRSRRIDLGLGLRGDLRENLLLRLAGVRERIGYGITGGGFFLTKEVHYRHRIHESERLVNLLRPLGIKTDALRPQLYFSEEEKARFAKKLAEWGLTDTGSYVGFQLGAGTASKDWPMENVRAFLKGFWENFPDFELVIVGTDPTKTDAAGLAPGGRYVNLVGRTTLRELCFVMMRLRAFVGPDSGPSHIASALGVSTIFLYSGTNRFEEWRPLLEAAVVFRNPVLCSPCELEVCNVPGHPCMSGIGSEKVLAALREKLALP